MDIVHSIYMLSSIAGCFRMEVDVKAVNCLTSLMVVTLFVLLLLVAAFWGLIVTEKLSSGLNLSSIRVLDSKSESRMASLLVSTSHLSLSKSKLHTLVNTYEDREVHQVHKETVKFHLQEKTNCGLCFLGLGNPFWGFSNSFIRFTQLVLSNFNSFPRFTRLFSWIA